MIDTSTYSIFSNSSSRIRLRAMEPSDVDLLYQWENDTTLWQYGNTRGYVSRHDLEMFIEHSDLDLYTTRQLRLMVCDQQTGLTVGCVDIYDYDPYHHHAYIAVLIGKQHQRLGYATVAVNTVANLCFVFWNMHCLCATTTAQNVPAQRLLARCGFLYVGSRPGWVMTDGRFVDERIYCKTGD